MGTGVYMSVRVQRKAGKSHHILGGGKGQRGTGTVDSESEIDFISSELNQ